MNCNDQQMNIALSNKPSENAHTCESCCGIRSQTSDGTCLKDADCFSSRCGCRGCRGCRLSSSDASRSFASCSPAPDSLPYMDTGHQRRFFEQLPAEEEDLVAMTRSLRFQPANPLTAPPPTSPEIPPARRPSAISINGGFKPGSIFYEAPPESFPPSVPEEMEPPPSLSKNSIFYQDFSVLPSSKFSNGNSASSSEQMRVNRRISNALDPIQTMGRMDAEKPSSEAIDWLPPVDDQPSVTSPWNAAKQPSTVLSTPGTPSTGIDSPQTQIILPALLMPSSAELSASSARQLLPVRSSTLESPVLSDTANDAESLAMKVAARLVPRSGSPSKLGLSFVHSQLIHSTDASRDSSVKVFYMPIRKNLLGNGRFSDVYRGTVSIDPSDSELTTIMEDATSPITPNTVRKPSIDGMNAGVVYTCAVKCLHTYEDAQLNGWTEASVLELFQNSAHRSNYMLQLISLELDANRNLSLVYEYCPNGNLWDFLKRKPEQCGLRVWIRWCRQLAEAVHLLHQKHSVKDFDKVGVAKNDFILIHNDIKPQNILLNRKLDIKLSDFGSAAILLFMEGHSEDNPPALDDGLGRGTQAYSAPESLSAPHFLFSAASDIYSLGCTFYALLTGREPFSDFRNPVQQLFAIRKGFTESGSNPFSRSAALNNSCQFHLFASGDRINSLSASSLLAQKVIVDLIADCTAVNPTKRPKIVEICRRLSEIDDILVPDSW